MNTEEDFVTTQDIAAALSNLTGEPGQASHAQPIEPRQPANAMPIVKSGRLNDDFKALGVATSQMMGDPSFGRLRFGHWARTLAGMINRKHYLIATEGKIVTGFIGWALTNETVAERWLEGKGEISYEDALDGDCVLINAWIAKTRATNKHLLNEIRRFGADRRLVYFKRFYPDGRMRPMRLEVTEFVGRHAGRNA